MSNPTVPKLGDSYFNLTLVECLEPSEGDKNNGGKWKYQCKCGNTGTVNGYRWSGSHRTKSCGCLNGQLISEANKKRRNPKEASTNLAHIHYSYSARNRGWEPLGREDWEEIVKQPCFYCGEIDKRERTKSRRPKNNKYSHLTREEEEEYTIFINGIDRVDPAKGYLKENCVSSCRMCNIMKNGYSVDSFFQRVKRIYEKNELAEIPVKPVCYETMIDQQKMSKRKRQ